MYPISYIKNNTIFRYGMSSCLGLWLSSASSQQQYNHHKPQVSQHTRLEV